MDNSLGKRIEQIRKIERLSIEEYMSFLDVTKTSYYNWRDGLNNPNVDVIIKILERFPLYNSDWILLGTGDMKKGSHEIKEVNEPTIKYGEPGLSKKDLKQLFKKMITEIDNL